MANNRLYLKCKLCSNGATNPPQITLLKYFPSMGWYRSASEDVVEKFLAEHHHATMWGAYLETEFEQTSED